MKSLKNAPGLSPALIARLSKATHQHKYDHGHALILSGPSGYGGAARLAAMSALRVGSGLVTLATPPCAIAEQVAHMTSVMVRPMADASALETLLKDARLNALCLGPALGVGDDTQQKVQVALAAGRATVLDADALMSFEPDPQSLFSMLHGNVVLTPHSGEFSRLFPQFGRLANLEDATAGLSVRRDAVRNAAIAAGCTVLLKGPVTLIASAAGQTAELHFLGANAAPWLATAGAGDVLAGVITGLLARGYSPIQAAELGAGLHVAAARCVGAGLIAEDLPVALPQVFRALGV